MSKFNIGPFRYTPCTQPKLYFNQCFGKNIAFYQMQVNSVVDYHISKTPCSHKSRNLYSHSHVYFPLCWQHNKQDQVCEKGLDEFINQIDKQLIRWTKTYKWMKNTSVSLLMLNKIDYIEMEFYLEHKTQHGLDMWLVFGFGTETRFWTQNTNLEPDQDSDLNPHLNHKSYPMTKNWSRNWNWTLKL
jgi:hypothetical protein